MLSIDHVIVLVPDLSRAADHLLDEYGLASVTGGRHTGHGTGNRIVPLGSNYLELMAVVDPVEAAGSAMGRWAAANTTADLTPAAVCLRTDDIASIGRTLDEEPEAMSRQRPDGSILSWRLVGLSDMTGPGNLPFFIEWQCQPEDHPAATPVEHRVDVMGITIVTIGAPGTLGPLLADVVGIRIEDGSGVIDMTIETLSGPLTLG